MVRYLGAAALVAVGVLWLCPPDSSAQGDKGWGTIKGKIIWGGADIPKRQPVKVTADQQHCLAKGNILDEDLVVNPKNKGVKWVIVWLVDGEGNAPPIAPALKEIKEKTVSLDQPMCMFMPRTVAIREGQQLEVKNSAPVNHNIQWIGDGINNPGGNVTLPPSKSYTIKDLQAQKLPLILRCNIHPWMQGRLAVFAHPYFAVTDDDGNFEIKMAPAGNYRVVAWQEKVGYRGGAKGRTGTPVEIKAGGTTDLGELKIGQ
ncbi:MAG: hypothetical protein IT429_00630 [Gemmataceae bacterium]|nr:hypothetical protein [Gemmataceae bacterium]